MRKLVIVLLLVALINCQDDGPMKIDVPPDFQSFQEKFLLHEKQIEEFVPPEIQQKLKEDIERITHDLEKQNLEEKERFEDLINYVNQMPNQLGQSTTESPEVPTSSTPETQIGTDPVPEEEVEFSSSSEEKRGRHGKNRHGGRKGGKHGGKWSRRERNGEEELDGQSREVVEHRNRWRQRQEKNQNQDQINQSVEGQEPFLQTSQPAVGVEHEERETLRDGQPHEDYSSSSESSSDEQREEGPETQSNYKGEDEHSRAKNHMRRFKKKFRKGGFKGPIFILLFVGVIVFACKKCRKQRRAQLQQETQIPQVITVPNQGQQMRYVQLTDEQLQILQQQQLRAAQPLQQQQPVIVGVPIQQQQPRQQLYVPQAFQVQTVPQVNRPQSQNAGIVIEMNPRRYPQINAEDIPVGQPVNNQYNYPSL